MMIPVGGKRQATSLIASTILATLGGFACTTGVESTTEPVARRPDRAEPVVVVAPAGTASPRRLLGDAQLALLRDGMSPVEVGEVLNSATNPALVAAWIATPQGGRERTIWMFVWNAVPRLVIHDTANVRTVQLDFGHDNRLNLSSERTTVVDEGMMAPGFGGMDAIGTSHDSSRRAEHVPPHFENKYSDAHGARVAGLINELVEGGLLGIRAPARLKRLGHGALAGVINKLRKLDYLDPEDTWLAHQLNKVLVDVAGGVVRPHIKVVALDEPVPADFAHWNRLVAEAWQRFWLNHRDPNEFAVFLAVARNRLSPGTRN